MKATKSGILEYLKGGFFKGVGFGIGFVSTSLFAAAAAMNVFSSGEVISATQLNRNFSIAGPEGEVSAFYLENCPEGWAPADGTNGTPDLRGQFIRARDDRAVVDGGQDPDGIRALGSVQLDAFQGHWHNVVSGRHAANAAGATSDFLGIIGTETQPTFVKQAISDGINGDPRTASETRPKNMALTFCIRKN